MVAALSGPERTVTDDPLAVLLDRWRADAVTLRRRGAPNQADALEAAAEDVEAACAEYRLEHLTVSEAADLGGYSESRLYELLEEGTIPNVGRRGAPRIRRSDVPRRPGHRSDAVQITAGETLADAALRAREG